MKYATGLISAAAAFVAMCLPTATAAQMRQGGMMGGGRYGMMNLASPANSSMISLVSPADSPTQIQSGTLMIGQYVFGMGSNMMGRGTPVPGGNGTPSLVLRLSGVSDANGLITNTGNSQNRLIFLGQLTTPADPNNPIKIEVDQPFVLNAGSAFVEAPLSLPPLTGRAIITIDQIMVADEGGNAFAVPGIALIQPTPQSLQPTPQSTPRPTAGLGCSRNSDCDDGNPNTLDLCMPMGCVHMPGHMGMGGHPMW